MHYLILLFFLLNCSIANAQASATTLTARKQLLAAELPLARADKIYFLIDLAASHIELRALGVPVTALPIEAYRLWGVKRPAAATRLVDKDALFEPQREVVQVVQPGTEITPSSDVSALELADMPTRYRLVLANGVHMNVMPAPSGFISGGVECVRRFGWWLTRPLISDWKYLRGMAYTEVRLALAPDDARLLYWALTEGADCLINWPQV